MLMRLQALQERNRAREMQQRYEQIGAAIANGIIQDLKNDVQTFMTTPGVPAPMTWA